MIDFLVNGLTDPRVANETFPFDRPTLFSEQQSSEVFIRGDADANGLFNGLEDALYILANQFSGGPPPPCAESADADGDAIFNGLTDALFVLAHQFSGGPPPPAPYPRCGSDPDRSTGLGCEMAACP